MHPTEMADVCAWLGVLGVEVMTAYGVEADLIDCFISKRPTIRRCPRRRVSRDLHLLCSM